MSTPTSTPVTIDLTPMVQTAIDVAMAFLNAFTYGAPVVAWLVAGYAIVRLVNSIIRNVVESVGGLFRGFRV